MKLKPNIFKCNFEDKYIRKFNLKEIDTLLVKANTGMGKTKECYRFVKEYLSKKTDARIIFLSHRISQSSKITGDLPSFFFYKDRNKNLQDHKLLSVQLESLHHYHPSAETIPDLLIIDESEELFKQVFSETNRKMFGRNLDVLKWFLKFSKAVICMSADLSNLTQDAVSHYRKHIRMESYTYKNKKDATAIIIEGIDEFVNMIICDVRDNKRIVIPTNSLKFANKIARVIKNIAKRETLNKNIGIYTSETSSSIKRKHFEDVNKHWMIYDILIYTPTCPSALSFEQKHYDKIYIYHTDSSCDFWSSMQMVDRIRDVSEKKYIFYVKAFGGNLPDTQKDIEKYLKTCQTVAGVHIDTSGLKCELDINGEYNFIKEDFTYKIYSDILRKNIQTKNRFKSLLVEYLEEKGFNIMIKRTTNKQNNEDCIKKLLQEAKENEFIERNQQIFEAPSLTQEEYEDFRFKLDKGIPLSHLEMLSYNKKKLELSYGGFTFVNSDQLGKYNSKTKIDQFKLNKKYVFFGGFDRMISAERKYVKSLDRSLDGDKSLTKIKCYQEIFKLRIEKNLLKLLGFQGLDPQFIKMNKVEKEKRSTYIKCYLKMGSLSRTISYLYEKRRLITTDNWNYTKSIRIINSILQSRYGYKIKGSRNGLSLQKQHQFNEIGHPRITGIPRKKIIELNNCKNRISTFRPSSPSVMVAF